MRLPGVRRYFRIDLRRRARLDDDIAAELTFHVQSRVDDLVACGVRADVARETALREFGDVQRITTDCRSIGRQRERDMRLKELLDSIAGDVAFGWRALRRAPGVAGRRRTRITRTGAAPAAASRRSGCTTGGTRRSPGSGSRFA